LYSSRVAQLLADILGLLSADPRRSQADLAARLDVFQPSVSRVMRLHGVERVCSGCNLSGVVSRHSCGGAELRITVRSRSGRLLLHQSGGVPVTVSDLGLGRRPIMVQAGAAELFLSKPDAEALAAVLGAASDVGLLEKALRDAGRVE
jgi:hypothetical protein